MSLTSPHGPPKCSRHRRHFPGACPSVFYLGEDHDDPTSLSGDDLDHFQCHFNVEQRTDIGQVPSREPVSISVGDFPPQDSNVAKTASSDTSVGSLSSYDFPNETQRFLPPSKNAFHTFCSNADDPSEFPLFSKFPGKVKSEYSGFVPRLFPNQVRRYYNEASPSRLPGLGALVKLWEALYRMILKSRSWFIIASIAIATGSAAACIELTIRTLTDIRLGLCRGAIWMSRNTCCGSQLNVDFIKNQCIQQPLTTQWRSWHTIVMGLNESPSSVPGKVLIDLIMYTSISIAFACLASLLCYFLAPLAAGSGISEVKLIAAGYVLPNVLSLTTGLVKIVGLALGAASGLQLGKEGPLVHIGCCFALFFLNMYKSSRDTVKDVEFYSVASAIAVSVAFCAPLAGVLFAMEEITSRFYLTTLWKSFFGAVSGIFVLKYIYRAENNSLTLFPMDSVSLLGTWAPIELIPFSILGLAGGFIGTIFIRLNTRWNQYKMQQLPWVSQHPILEVLGVTLICNLLNFPFLFLRTPNFVVLEQMFSRCGEGIPDVFFSCTKDANPAGIADYTAYILSPSVFFHLALAVAIRFFQTVFTFGLTLPSGLFVPSLMIGALLGRFVGLLTIKLNLVFGFADCHQCLHPGVYAIVGAAATLAGVTRMTVFVVIIMFELTGGLSYVASFMLSVVIAKWVAEAMHPYSIYDCVIQLRKYPPLKLSHKTDFTLKVADILDHSGPIFYLSQVSLFETFETQLDRIARSHAIVPVLADKTVPTLIGYVDVHELKQHCVHLRKHLPAMTLAHTWVTFVAESSSLPHRLDLGGTSGTKQFHSLSHYIRSDGKQLNPGTPLNQVYNLFAHSQNQFCFVTQDDQYVGCLTKSQFVSRFDDTDSN